MVGHRGISSASSYLTDPTSPIPSHCASIVATSTLRVNSKLNNWLYRNQASLNNINSKLSNSFAVDLSKDLIPKTYDSYHSHLYAYHIPNETKNYIINSFLPRTVSQWNNLRESIVLTPSLESFKDGVVKLKH